MDNIITKIKPFQTFGQFIRQFSDKCSKTPKSKSNKKSTPSKPKTKKKSSKPKVVCKPKKKSLPGQAGGSKADMWRKISLFGIIPFALIFSGFTFATLSHDERQEFIPYTYLIKRDKRFPWGEGEKSFFHNKHANALKDGYED